MHSDGWVMVNRLPPIIAPYFVASQVDSLISLTSDRPIDTRPRHTKSAKARRPRLNYCRLAYKRSLGMSPRLWFPNTGARHDIPSRPKSVQNPVPLPSLSVFYAHANPNTPHCITTATTHPSHQSPPPSTSHPNHQPTPHPSRLPDDAPPPKKKIPRHRPPRLTKTKGWRVHTPPPFSQYRPPSHTPPP